MNMRDQSERSQPPLEGDCSLTEYRAELFFVLARLPLYIFGLLLAGSLLNGIVTKFQSPSWPELTMQANFGEDWRDVMKGASETNRSKFELMRAFLENCAR